MKPTTKDERGMRVKSRRRPPSESGSRISGSLLAIGGGGGCRAEARGQLPGASGRDPFPVLLLAAKGELFPPPAPPFALLQNTRPAIS